MAQTATQQLQTEWITLPEVQQQPELRLYVAKPAEGTYPAVIVIHEAWGPDEHIQDVTRRFAGEGYVAIAPDLFWIEPFGRTVKPEEMREIFQLRSTLPESSRNDPTALEEVIAKLPSEKAQRLRDILTWQARRDMAAMVGPLQRVISWAREREDTTSSVGAVGFCFGGGMVLRLVFEGADLNAAAPFYGRNPPLDQANRVRSPLLLMYGRKDPFIMPGVPALLEAVTKANLDFGMHIYENAGHAFLNDTRPQMYNAEAAQDAWRHVRHFFRQHLHQG